MFFIRNIIFLGLTVLFKCTCPSIVEIPVPLMKKAKMGENWSFSGSGLLICHIDKNVKVAESYIIFAYTKVAPANEVYAKMEYQLKDCFRSQICSYTFNVHALTADSAYPDVPKLSDHKYSKVGELKNKTVLKQDAIKHFVSTISIPTGSKAGLYLAFTTSGACGGIKIIKLWYNSCPSPTGKLLTFPSTATPDKSVPVLYVQGTCVDNSVALTSTVDNFMKCYRNGTAEINGGCQCEAGYYIKGSQQCVDCPAKAYKPFRGDGPCFECTANVKDGLLPRKSLCECLDGFFRPIISDQNYTTECEAPPTPPRSLNASIVSSEWAILTWKEPEKIGTGGRIEYEIHCKQCDVKVHVTDQLRYNITNLKTYAVFNITIYAINNVTKAIKRSHHGKLSFKTLSGLPSNVRELRVIRNDDGSVTITWSSPAAKGGPDLQYHLIVNGNAGFFIKKSNYTIIQQATKKQYEISVRSHTNAGFSKAETISFAIDGKAKGIPLTVAIGVGIAFAIIIIIAIVCIVIVYRRRHPSHLQTVRLENGTVKLPKSGGHRFYVEPTTYQDVADAVREFANPLERDWIDLGHIIGSGEFGDVYKGTLQRPLEDEQVVAIKTLKGNATKKASDDFLSEAAYMGQFNHPNVISLEGVIVKDKPVMIVIEYMSNGSLETYLQQNDSRLSKMQLLGMASGVSSGMTYLSELSFIHRDLAARNILVDENMVCKVADFGMSRELSSDDAYNTTGGKIPVRWTSPEAIQYKKFTSASDVWSYGILLWEIMSYGERPYWDWGNYEVIERLASGYRLPPPMGCPKVVHDLMLSCWQKDRIKRPKFRDILNTIEKWIRNPELLKQEASVVTRRDENLDYASMSTLKEWLDSIRMGQYIENFTSKNLVTPRQILQLTEDELKDIGVIAVGHRMKIMKSIKATRDQLSEEDPSESTL